MYDIFYDIVKRSVSYLCSSLVYCSMRNSDEMTIGKTHLGQRIDPRIYLTFSGGKRPYVDEMNNGNKLSNNYKDVRMTKKKRAD